MCGVAGIFDPAGETPDAAIVRRMGETLIHRGPDADGHLIDEGIGLAFRRLSIVDLEHGHQPMTNEDGSCVLVCNGEIFNHGELRRWLASRGHRLRTCCDVEVIVHLYEELGVDMMPRLDGQFAFALFDRRRRQLLLARDPFGVCPMYVTHVGESLLFASEIKALLAHPAVPRRVDLTGLDQVLSLPGLVSPRTMFEGIESLRPGTFLLARDGQTSTREYWDLDYPLAEDDRDSRDEEPYVEQLAALLEASIVRRMQADVPVGLYLSGGIDSSLIATLVAERAGARGRHSFSVTFNGADMCERKYQRLVAAGIGTAHREIAVEWPALTAGMSRMLYHAECPVKESYNVCSLALSQAVRETGVKVVLTGEGADELLAGYVGYRFDQFGLRDEARYGLHAALEEDLRQQLWGDPNCFYEIEQHAFRDVKRAMYSARLAERFDEFDFIKHPLINHDRVCGRHPLHQRSYLDFKLRLCDHLVADHGDRMALANSVEARYPFLDAQLVEFLRHVPVDLKLSRFTEKYLLKRVAEGRVPAAVIQREKFGFHAPGSPYLLQQDREWVEDMLSFDRVKRQGYFDPTVIARLKAEYAQADFRLALPFENDLLMIVLTFTMFVDMFALPSC